MHWDDDDLECEYSWTWYVHMINLLILVVLDFIEMNSYDKMDKVKSMLESISLQYFLKNVISGEKTSNVEVERKKNSLKSVYFKKTVAQSSFLSKVLSFSLILF